MSTVTETTPPVVKRARLTALGLFDVAYAIDLQKARVLCADSSPTDEPVASLTFDVPPLRLTHAAIEISLANGPVMADVAVHLYDFGAIALAITCAVEDLPWVDFVAMARHVEEALAFDRPSAPWMPLLAEAKARIATALDRPNESTMREDYHLIEIDAFAEPLTDVLHRTVDLSPLLAGDPRPLSQEARDILLRHRFAYLAEDCVVVTRDRALLYQPGGDAGIAAVLEVANAQLLELRYYSNLLDDELPRMYDLVDRTRTVSAFFAPSELSRLARRLYTVWAEVTELTEKVENALEAMGHPYLAQVYTATLELFGVPALGVAVDRKLEIVRDTYAALYDEASVSRAGILEITIVLLIAVELVLAIFK